MADRTHVNPEHVAKTLQQIDAIDGVEIEEGATFNGDTSLPRLLIEWGGTTFWAQYQPFPSDYPEYEETEVGLYRNDGSLLAVDPVHGTDGYSIGYQIFGRLVDQG